MSPTWCDFTFPGGKSIVYFIHRLYSDYLYFASSNKSADDFHEKVTEALQLFENCMLDYSLRACVYNNTLNNAMPVRIHQARPAQSGATRMLFCAGGGRSLCEQGFSTEMGDRASECGDDAELPRSGGQCGSRYSWLESRESSWIFPACCLCPSWPVTQTLGIMHPLPLLGIQGALKEACHLVRLQSALCN